MNPKVQKTLDEWVLEHGPVGTTRELWACASAVAAAQREVDAERVPTSWLDPLLSSPEAEALAKKSPTLFVEHLLRAVRDRIRKGDSNG